MGSEMAEMEMEEDLDEWPGNNDLNEDYEQERLERERQEREQREGGGEEAALLLGEAHRARQVLPRADGGLAPHAGGAAGAGGDAATRAVP